MMPSLASKGGALLMSYSLCPHTVLQCDLGASRQRLGRRLAPCKVRYNTSSEGSGCPSGGAALRGSTVPVLLRLPEQPPRWLAVAHMRPRAKGHA